MSNSELVVYKRLSPNKTHPRNHSIDTITIHVVDGDLTVEQIGTVFARKARSARKLKQQTNNSNPFQLSFELKEKIK